MEGGSGGVGARRKIIIQLEVGRAVTMNSIIFHPVSRVWIVQIVIFFFFTAISL